MKTFTKFVLVILSVTIFSINAIAQFQVGDLFVAVAGGNVQWRSNTGVIKGILNNGTTGFTTGMTLDTSDNLYVTTVTPSIFRFDKFGTLLPGTFGSGMVTAESILFDMSHNAYVGDVAGGIHKFNLAGTALATYIPGTRVDWIDLAADNCTVLYTQEGTNIQRFNVCTNTPGPIFASGLGGNAFALRIRTNKDVLLANGVNILRLDSTGTIVQTYDVPGHNSWFALNLDPDGSSFWSADYSLSNVWKFNIATGDTLFHFNTGTGSFTVFGLALKGEITVSTQLFIDVEPKHAINPINTQHCVTATVTDQNGVLQNNQLVNFLVRGTHSAVGSGNTNTSGQVQFCYTGTMVGCDTIFATIHATGKTDTAYKCWDIPSPVELTGFSSTVDKKDVSLNWSTATEINNSGFDIERKSANEQWSKIGFVQGNGTTTSPQRYSYADRNLNSGTYNYRLKQFDYSGNFEYFNLSNNVSIGIPESFNLSQNYPNPFNPATQIDFELPAEGNIILSVYDDRGKLMSTLEEGTKPAGYYSVKFNASNLASGVYFYKLQYNTGIQSFEKVMKMSLIK